MGAALLSACSQAAPLKTMHGLASRLHPPRDPGNSDICLKAAAGGEAQAWLGQARLGQARGAGE